MKTYIKKLICCILSLFVLCSVTAGASQSGDITAQTALYLTDTVSAPTFGVIGGEWLVIGLARSGADAPDGYFEKYYENICKYVEEKDGILHDKKYTEYSRLALALTSIGKNPTDVGGYDILAPLGDYEKVIIQGTNGPAFALIALDSKNYEMPVCNGAAIQATRQMYIDYILSMQKDDGGFALSSSVASDVDVTAMALQALSNYTGMTDVNQAIDKAVTYLSMAQSENGGFTVNGTETSESCCQVITALCALNISIDDTRFVKNGNSVMDALLSYRLADGGFIHTHGASEFNLMATEQALYALAAYDRMITGKTKLYDMTDVSYTANETPDTSFGLAERSENIKLMPVVNPGKTFDDTDASIYKNEILALAERNIINGQTQTLFNPGATMTRAEFAAITVKALGLPLTEDKIFDDVSDGDWHYKYISTAYGYGIINGVSETHFDPESTITREEAAVMIARAAKLCGMDNTLPEEAVKNILAQFDDYVTVSDWAASSLAFCYNEGILSSDTMTILPSENIKRDEIAYMVYNMLDAAKLIGE